MISCHKCGASFTRKFNLKRHQASRCKGRMLVDTVRNMNNSYQPKEGNVADALINKVIDDDDEKITNGPESLRLLWSYSDCSGVTPIAPKSLLYELIS